MSTELIADGGARGIIGLGAKDVDMLLADSMDEEYQSMQEKLSKQNCFSCQYIARNQVAAKWDYRVFGAACR